MRENLFKPEHRTNVLPLRWLANYIFHPISMLFFKLSLKWNEDNWDSDLLTESTAKSIYAWKIYNFMNYPYEWWGTVYVFNTENLDDLGGSGWDDYDENGIPYWDYLWHEDPQTGDAWRLVEKK